MPLASGTRLGPYEIQSALGAGGMGEVYKARDTRLDRTVAIKVLPEHVASDPDLKQRFEREAKILAALSHPHICAAFDVGCHDGTDFLVMEYLEGETLAQRLTKGAPPLNQAMQVAIQIVDALDKAHRKGIVHRDLKPGNIMLTKAGAKLLDFGLARLQPATVTSEIAVSAVPTVSSPLTGAGTILGTFQYMAPEQLEGQEADTRTDIFAFGAVSYEMVTGKKAFEGKSQASLIAAILERDPTPVSTLQPMVPGSLDHVVKKCLAKDPDRRWQSASDVCDELKWVVETWVAAGTRTPVVPPFKNNSRLAKGVAAPLLAAVLAWGAAFVYFREAPSPPAPEIRTDINTPSTTDPVSFALSPDGRHVVFVASGDRVSRLWLRPLAATEAQPLAGTERALYPFWSPDSRSVGFFADGKLKRIDIGGRQPETLTDAAPRGGTWNADGVILFTRTATGSLLRISASGGEAAAATKLDRQSSHRFPHFLPDGRQFLFYAQGTPDTGGIYLGTLDSGDTKRLTAADAAGVYMPSGWLVWLRSGELSVQRLDMVSKELVGAPVTLADAVAFDIALSAPAVSVSATGLVAYRSGGANRRQLAWFDRAGRSLGTIGSPDETLSTPRLSPDARRVTVYRGVQGNQDIWILDGTRASRFTFDAALDQFPIWSPDGSRIVFRSNRTGSHALYTKLSSGGGSDELLLVLPQDLMAMDWSPDGRFLLYFSSAENNGDVWVLPMEGDRKPWPLANSDFREGGAHFSPDGRWVAYMSNESGRAEIYVRQFALPGSGATSSSAGGTGGQWQVSTEGGIYPHWGPSGKELHYIGPDGQMMAVSIATAATTAEPGIPVVLFPTRIYGGGVDNQQNRQYDVTREGRFLINTVLEDAAPPITVLQNWNPPR